MARKLLITVDHSKCVGNGTCLTIATHVFEHNWDRQSVVVNPEGDPPELILEAADNCPVSAISVKDAETGETLFNSVDRRQ
ncbi:MAG TPA: ferredoxin [Gemmatimonadales bacterium]|nr:ferredoxin [Gemmatimonadales bacterium]